MAKKINPPDPQTIALVKALRRLWGCPDLNLESLEPETVKALNQATRALKPFRNSGW